MATQTKQYYSAKAQHFACVISALERRNRAFVVGEIITFLGAAALFAAYCLSGLNVLWLVSAIVAAVVYAVVRRLDVRNSLLTAHAEALLRVYENEMDYCAGRYDAFADGLCYRDAAHPYTFDLDVFGPESLYQRICRTATTGGSDCLAGWLKGQWHYDADGVAAHIVRRADAIEALKQHEEWRAEWRAVGNGAPIDSLQISSAAARVQQMQLGDGAARPAVLALSAVALAAFYALVAASCFGLLPAAAPLSVALLLVAGQMWMFGSQLCNLSRAVDALNKTVQRYVQLVTLADELREKVKTSAQNKSGELPQLLDELEGASPSFAAAQSLVRSLDRRGHALWMVLADIFALNDLLLMRRAVMWQHTLAGNIDRWTDCVHRLDALVSMATFACNEPSARRADVFDGPEVSLSACGLWHPFLRSGRAVANDFTISPANYYIITGANMAGKSTFLRALGVNWLLAMCGLPVFALNMRLSVFALFTSMRTTDDLTHGISYFNAELLRLQQLLDYCDAHPRTLIILDEILKGTNSADKLNGSRLFLNYIAERRITGVIATHDLELSRMADASPQRFHNYCFEIQLGNDVTYSYTITPGVARNQNATFLLKQMLGKA